jgi:chemotaxis protein CheD
MSDAPVRVAAANAAVRAAPAFLEALGLGSCVAIIVWDAERRVGGLAHVLLPEPAPRRSIPAPARYATTAVPALLASLRGLGSDGPLVATLVGGAGMFGEMLKVRGVHMGERNVEAARAALADAGVPIIAEDVLGGHARSVRFSVADGRVAVRTLAHGARVL